MERDEYGYVPFDSLFPITIGIEQEYLGLGDTLSGWGAPLESGWTSIALDSGAHSWDHVGIEFADGSYTLKPEHVDESLQMFQITRDMMPADASETDLAEVGKWIGNYNNMPLFADEQFDGAHGTCLLEEKPNWHELARVLKSEAYLMVSSCGLDYAEDQDIVIADAAAAGFVLVERGTLLDPIEYADVGPAYFSPLILQKGGDATD